MKKNKFLKQAQPLKTAILQGNNLDVLQSLGMEINSIWTTSETIPMETESLQAEGLGWEPSL